MDANSNNYPVILRSSQAGYSESFAFALRYWTREDWELHFEHCRESEHIGQNS